MTLHGSRGALRRTSSISPPSAWMSSKIHNSWPRSSSIYFKQRGLVDVIIDAAASGRRRQERHRTLHVMVCLRQKVEIQVFRCAFTKHLLNERYLHELLSRRHGFLHQLLEIGHRGRFLCELNQERSASFVHNFFGFGTAWARVCSEQIEGAELEIGHRQITAWFSVFGQLARRPLNEVMHRRHVVAQRGVVRYDQSDKFCFRVRRQRNA